MDTLVQPQTVYFSKFVQAGMTIQKQWSSAWGFTFSVNYISLIYPPQEKEKDSKGKQVSETMTELKLKKKISFTSQLVIHLKFSQPVQCLVFKK